jgi:serine/threonine protein kinase
MGSVFLCEHKLMRRRVAVKVLPTAKAEDPSSLERFYREARAVAALDHPNIVRAYDIDQDDNLHFLVMEYVDGSSLQEICKKVGPLDVLRACQYMYQSATGLQHAHETAGLVHRDIKPGNILVDRNGVVKILDMGLARFFHDDEDILTKKYDENVLGTADYLAPEQAIDSHGVDIRADVYSLGATFYYCLTGKTPFSEGTVAQKLIWHQTRQPKPIRNIRPEVPASVVAVVDKMMAKEAGQRYQTPSELMEALQPWMQTPIPPPPAEEMPRLCAAATGGPPMPAEATASPQPVSVGMPSPSPRKNWQVTPAPSSRAAASAPAGPPAAGSGERPIAAPPSPAQGTNRATLTRPVPPPPVASSMRPTPRPGPHGQTIKESAPPGEEAVAWEQVAGETQEAAAAANTAPSGPRKISRSSALRPSIQAYRARERRRLLIVVTVVAAVAIISLTITLIIVLRGDTSKTNTGTNEPPSNMVYVDARGKQGASRLREALRNAKPGHRIVVSGPIEDPWDLTNGGVTKGVTLEADPGANIEWRVPLGSTKAQTTLLTLGFLEAFTLKGFTFDGGGQVRDLITIKGDSPGLVLEDIKLKNFQRAGISFLNCQGTSERPVLVRRIQFLASTKPADSGFIFDTNPQIKDGINKHIEINKVTLDSGTKFSKGLVQPVQPGFIDKKTVILPPGN